METRKPDHIVDTLEGGFDLCRERDRPIIVELKAGSGYQYKLYPGGKALRALNALTPFQEYQDPKW